MVSEDSDQLGSGLLTIHRRDYFNDVRQTRMGEVIAPGDSPHATSKLLKVVTLYSPQRMFLEERDDDPLEVRASSDGVPVHVLTMIVVTGVDVDPPPRKRFGDPVDTRDYEHLVSRRTRRIAECRSCSRVGSCDSVVPRRRLRSILLRLQNQ